ncbi:alanine racemase [Ramlibacter sp. 2FC]|uniref:alanine racemase n=1 Tax=Ramlibacter sp. 2FC TaxID=2502188 RepID=UPI0010F53920|nr:alanine racemase [Ramlibacter sp. 2FC]
MSRPARALIDLAALRHNYRLAHQRHGGRALAVLKANAYGHGAVRCAQALAPLADGFAVAFLEEALALREAGIRAPILLLEGVFAARDFEAVHRHGLWTVVHHAEQIRMIELSEAPPASLRVWLKLDSGMHRAGFAPQALREAHARLMASGKLDRPPVLMSHFARADEPEVQATRRQLEVFGAATAGLAGETSLCNSAGLLAWPEAHGDWARPGILLYGADPLGGGHGLRPVMRLSSEVFAVRQLAPGEALGYGGSFVADQPTRVGLVALGYADGYPRSAPTGTPLAVDGQASRTLGRVSMDMMTVDLSQLPEAGLGSQVELWGPQVDVNQVAQRAGTIAYELLCNVKRAPLAYQDS